jgi:L-ascorbate metabolism protein UlaG (beta-lactamase superfamily)
MEIGGAIHDGNYVRAGSVLSVCRIDCCTFIVEMEGCVALFDPWINDPAKFAPLWGSFHEEPLVIQTLPTPDILLISQDAPDHCDTKAIANLSKDVDVIAPPSAERKLRKLGFSVRARAAGKSEVVRDIKISALPSEHPGVLKQNGYFLEGKKAKILVLADPAMTVELMASVDALPKPIDAILVASTAFTLRYFGQIVMAPEEAALLAARSGARHVFPTRTLMHERVWGILGWMIVKSFVPPEKSLKRFSDELRRIAPAVKIHKLERGQGCVVN